MDVFKLAFETIIVGLLALPWLGVAAYLLFPDFLIDLTKKFPDLVKDNQASLGVAVLTLAYCLGSAILPIANQLVNDEHWPLNENAIRCQVFTKQEHELEFIQYSAMPKDKGLTLKILKPDHCSYWAPVFYPTEAETGLGKGRGIVVRIVLGIWRFLRLWAGRPAVAGEKNTEAKDEELEANGDKDKAKESDEFKAKKILRLFEQEESTVLNQSSDTGSGKTEQLRQLHERVVVLRGAVFSGFVFLLLCVFAFFTQVHGQPWHWIRLVCGTLLALSLAAFAVVNGGRDLADQNIFDIPVLETLLVVISFFGFAVVVFKGVKTQLFRTKRCVLIALFFTGLTYGGWMWSEIVYDQKVISSFAVLQSDAEARGAVSHQAPRP